jgi:hypothetical protein
MKSKVVRSSLAAKTTSTTDITKRLTFAEVQAISPQDDCPLEKLDLAQLVISQNDLEKIHLGWNMRNEIDGDGAICLSDDLLAKAMRWYLRSLDIDFAIRKTRIDEVYAREVLETEATYARLAQNPSLLSKLVMKRTKATSARPAQKPTLLPKPVMKR